MPETVTDIVIKSSPGRVWQVVSNLSWYVNWNPLIRRVSGQLDRGRTLTVIRITSNGSAGTSRPTVTVYRPGRELRWRTRAMLPGLLDTETGFKVERLGPEQVRFVHWQQTSGLLAVGMDFWSSSRMRDQLETINLALKGVIESGPPMHAPPARRSSQAAPAPTSAPNHLSQMAVPATRSGASRVSA
jgi:hypothetical protein